MVTFNRKRASLHQRRGISTIVGGAIFLILFASAFSTFFIAMDAQRDTINTQRTISDSMMEKTKEKFAIAVSTDDSNNNRLAIQVKNLGTNPVEVGNIWIINNSGNFPAKKYLIDYKDSIIPSGYGSDILDSTPLFMYADDYDIKVVSTLGTIEKSELTIGSGNNLRATLIAIPPEVKVGQNVTLTMHVENIGNTRLLNVAPVNDTGKLHPNIFPEFTTPHPAPPQPIDLDPGEGVFFIWKYETTGSSGSIIKFNANASATEEITGFFLKSNTAYEKIELKTPDLTEVIVLTEDLLSRPEIFMIIASPFGAGDEKSILGANIVNPTGQDMFVSKVAISILSPRGFPSDVMLNPTLIGAAKCEPEAIGPTNDADWACLVQNQLVWRNLANPVKISPYSMHPFAALVHTDGLSGPGDELASVIVHGDVFTSVGEFGKAGYSTSFDDGDTALTNVFLSDRTFGTDKDFVIVNMTGTRSNEIVKFNATLVDYDDTAAHIIEDGSRLVINIPKGWTVNPASINGFGDFDLPIQYLPFPDTSSQITGVLTLDYDGTGPAGLTGKTIYFEATAPTVSNTQMYVMYLLAEGETDFGDFQISPLAEIVLQVIP